MEGDLKVITSMLVLATMKRSSTEIDGTLKSVEAMFQAADENQDGNLSVSEWYRTDYISYFFIKII